MFNIVTEYQQKVLIVYIVKQIYQVKYATTSVTIGNTQAFTAIARDQYNNEMTGISIIWNSGYPSIGSIYPNTGKFTVMTGLSVCNTILKALSGGIDGNSPVTVTATLPILHS